MKKLLIQLWTIITAALFVQCFELKTDISDNPIYTVLDEVSNGAIIRTIDIKSGEFNSFDTSTFFEVVIEEQDEENGALLKDLKVFVNFDDNSEGNGTITATEKLWSTIPASEFTLGASNLPRKTLKFKLQEVLDFFNIQEGEFTGGDAVSIRLELTLTDGRIFSSDDTTGSLQGSFFSSPYAYKPIIKCIPLEPIPGIYTFEMEDSFGDGWQGSMIKVTVDGEEKFFGIPEDNDDHTFENYTGDQSSGTATLEIPEGTSTIKFEWISGSWPSECSFTIKHTKLDGTAEQTSYSESNPSEGEKILSICVN